MIVNRTDVQEGPAIMTVYFRDGGTDVSAQADFSSRMSSIRGPSKAPEPLQGERVVTIDMKGRRSEAILKDFLDKSGAVPVKPTTQEEMQMQDIEELRKTREADAELGRRRRAAEKREEAMLAQARNEAAALKANSG